VRETLSHALADEPAKGRVLVGYLISLLQGSGGFRESSANYAGADAIGTAIDAFAGEGFVLASDGDLRPRLLASLSGAAVTEALEAQVRRAQEGADDAALVIGTGKDLVEATAAHVLVESYGAYQETANFPTLLGQAYVALGLATSQHAKQAGERAQCDVERQLFALACALNRLRNKDGTGHGRPWLPDVTDAEARVAVHGMGLVSDLLLSTPQVERVAVAASYWLSALLHHSHPDGQGRLGRVP
jgi:hypothetical protein